MHTHTKSISNGVSSPFLLTVLPIAGSDPLTAAMSTSTFPYTAPKSRRAQSIEDTLASILEDPLRLPYLSPSVSYTSLYQAFERAQQRCSGSQAQQCACCLSLATACAAAGDEQATSKVSPSLMTQKSSRSQFGTYLAGQAVAGGIGRVPVSTPAATAAAVAIAASGLGANTGLGMESLPARTFGVVSATSAPQTARVGGASPSLGPSTTSALHLSMPKMAHSAALPCPRPDQGLERLFITLTQVEGAMERRKQQTMTLKDVTATTVGEGAAPSSLSPSPRHQTSTTPSFLAPPNLFSTIIPPIDEAEVATRLTKDCIVDFIIANDTQEGALTVTEVAEGSDGADDVAGSPLDLASKGKASQRRNVSLQQQQSSSPRLVTTHRPLLDPHDTQTVTHLAELHQFRCNNSEEVLSRIWASCESVALEAKAEREKFNAIYSAHKQAAMEAKSSMQSPQSPTSRGGVKIMLNALNLQKTVAVTTADTNQYGRPATPTTMLSDMTTVTAASANMGMNQRVMNRSEGSFLNGTAGSSELNTAGTNTANGAAEGNNKVSSLTGGVTFMMADRGWLANHPSLENMTPPSPGRAIGFNLLETPQTISTIATLTTAGTGWGTAACASVSNGAVSNTSRPHSPTSGKVSAQRSLQSTPQHKSAPIAAPAPHPPLPPLVLPSIYPASVHAAPKGLLPYPIALYAVTNILNLHNWAGQGKGHTLKELVALVRPSTRLIAKAFRRARVLMVGMTPTLRMLLATVNKAVRHGKHTAEQEAEACSNAVALGPYLLAHEAGPHAAFLIRYLSLINAEGRAKNRLQLQLQGSSSKVLGEAMTMDTLAEDGSPTAKTPTSPTVTLIPQSLVTAVEKSLLAALVVRQPLNPMERALLLANQRQPQSQLHSSSSVVGGPPHCDITRNTTMVSFYGEVASTQLQQQLGGSTATNDLRSSTQRRQEEQQQRRVPLCYTEKTLTYHLAQHHAIVIYVSTVQPPSSNAQMQLWEDYVNWIEGLPDTLRPANTNITTGLTAEDSGMMDGRKTKEGSPDFKVGPEENDKDYSPLSPITRQVGEGHPTGGGVIETTTTNSIFANNSPFEFLQSPIYFDKASSATASIAVLQYAHFVLGIDCAVLAAYPGCRFYPTVSEMTQPMLLNKRTYDTVAKMLAEEASTGSTNATSTPSKSVSMATAQDDALPLEELALRTTTSHSSGSVSPQLNAASATATGILPNLPPGAKNVQGRLANTIIPTVNEELENQGYDLTLVHHAINLFSDTMFVNYIPVRIDGGGVATVAGLNDL